MDPKTFSAEIARVTGTCPTKVTRPYPGVLSTTVGECEIRRYGPNDPGHPWAVLKTVGPMEGYPHGARTLDRAWLLASGA